ncbi:hypothetical protein F9C11_31065 [Amycolatopsis sp. VS8301801F10]|uniref:hypothetical protein n=1 Tax=Amycolatopsis sp. VS8301801F10 TaxID=2652442 RepID=UPI0038FD1185
MNPLEEAGRIAAAVRELPEVADVHSGRFGRVATLGAGGRVGGVRVTEEDVTVGVTVRTPFSAGDVAAAVRAAVASPGRPVHVLIADVADAADTDGVADVADADGGADVADAAGVAAAETESENGKETVS